MMRHHSHRITSWHGLVCWAIALLLCGCAGRRALPEEAGFTLPVRDARWWVCSGWDRETSIHGMAVITMETNAEGQRKMSLFASRVDAQGQQPRWESQRMSGDSLVTTRTGRQLVTVRRPMQPDSAAAFFSVTRRRWTLQVEQSGGTWLELEAALPKQRPLAQDTLTLGDAQLVGLTPSAAPQGAMPQLFSLDHGMNWLQHAGGMGNYVAWMHLAVQDTGLGGQATYLLVVKQDASGGLPQMQCMRWRAGGRGELCDVRALPRDSYVSTLSGKSYPVKWELLFPGSKEVVMLTPLLPDQEVRMKRSSFWMGGVKVEAAGPDGQTWRSTGQGNMFIFRQQ